VGGQHINPDALSACAIRQASDSGARTRCGIGLTDLQRDPELQRDRSQLPALGDGPPHALGVSARLRRGRSRTWLSPAVPRFGQLRMPTAREMMRPSVTNEIRACALMSAFARREIGSVSAALNAVAVVTPSAK
jgi:hypothetical protein